MTQTIRVPRGGSGLNLADGTEYKADCHGRVHVDRSDHARQILRNPQMRYYDAIDGGVWRIHGGDGWTCSCGFSAWPWQHECPRCGRENA